jgi:hypothetical protein
MVHRVEREDVSPNMDYLPAFKAGQMWQSERRIQNQNDNTNLLREDLPQGKRLRL